MAVLHYNFHSHPKIVGLSNAAVGVFALALSYASGNLTDGHIPFQVARQWDKNLRPFKRLEEAGLVERTPDGYFIRDYLQYNPPAEVVKAKREAARDRARALRSSPRRDKRGTDRGQNASPQREIVDANNTAEPRTTEPNSVPAKGENTRQEPERVHVYVPDVGQLQDQELKPGSPLTVVQDAEESVSLDVDALNVVELDSRRGEPRDVASVMDELVRLRRGKTG